MAAPGDWPAGITARSIEKADVDASLAVDADNPTGALGLYERIVFRTT
jgi:hypothetical protein